MSLTQSPRYLITGASAGIGEELARQLAKKGYIIGGKNFIIKLL